MDCATIQVSRGYLFFCVSTFSPFKSHLYHIQMQIPTLLQQISHRISYLCDLDSEFCPCFSNSSYEKVCLLSVFLFGCTTLNGKVMKDIAQGPIQRDGPMWPTTASQPNTRLQKKVYTQCPCFLFIF